MWLPKRMHKNDAKVQSHEFQNWFPSENVYTGFIYLFVHFIYDLFYDTSGSLASDGRLTDD
jgi:hypothetical protein